MKRCFRIVRRKRYLDIVDELISEVMTLKDKAWMVQADNWVSPNKANHLRAEWNRCSIETDIKKEALEEQGFKFIWDYW